MHCMDCVCITNVAILHQNEGFHYPGNTLNGILFKGDGKRTKLSIDRQKRDYLHKEINGVLLIQTRAASGEVSRLRYDAKGSQFVEE